jgi:hypothetical protein
LELSGDNHLVVLSHDNKNEDNEKKNKGRGRIPNMVRMMDEMKMRITFSVWVKQKRRGGLRVLLHTVRVMMILTVARVVQQKRAGG